MGVVIAKVAITRLAMSWRVLRLAAKHPDRLAPEPESALPFSRYGRVIKIRN